MSRLELIMQERSIIIEEEMAAMLKKNEINEDEGHKLFYCLKHPACPRGRTAGCW